MGRGTGLDFVETRPVSWLPEEFWVIVAAPVGLEIPVGTVGQPLDAAAEKKQVRASTVGIGVNPVPMAHRRKPAIVEQPWDVVWDANRSEAHLLGIATAVHLSVEAVMKEVVRVAAAGIPGADPDTAFDRSCGVGPPWTTVIGRDIEDPRQIHVPSLGDGLAAQSAVRGQEILIFHREQVSGDAPLPQVGDASDVEGLGARPYQRGGEQAGQHGDDRGDQQQFDE